MALVDLASPSAPHKGTTGFTNIRSSAILTNSYVGSDSVKCGDFTTACLHIEFTKGSLTSLELKPQYSDDGGTSWNDIAVPGSPTAGVYSPALAAVYQFTANATCGIVLDVTPYDLFRVAANGTGTLTSSLLAMSISLGIRTHDSF